LKDTSSSTKVETEPGVADAESGYVFLDGPDGVAVTLTPDAAEEMGHRLIAAAKLAMIQNQGTPAWIYDRI
jgi:hypothetical protein